MLIDLKEGFMRVATAEAIASVLNEVIALEHPFDREKEHFFAIGINPDHSVKYIDLVSLGSLNNTISHPREVFRQAISQGAHSLIICHSRPGGGCYPNEWDIKNTSRMVEAGRILGIRVLDHIILENNMESFFSIKTELPDSNIRWKSCDLEK